MTDKKLHLLPQQLHLHSEDRQLLTELLSAVRTVQFQLYQLIRKERKMTLEVSNLIAAVGSETTVMDGAITAMNHAGTVMVDAGDKFTVLAQSLLDNAEDRQAVANIVTQIQNHANSLKTSGDLLISSDAKLEEALTANTEQDTDGEAPISQPE